MSARDLIGRPLVPFFDADENVNDALATDAGLSFETGDVDARVWNKELGYFEYPSDQTASSSDGSASNQRSASASKRGKGASSSAPIAIQSKKTPHAHAHSSEIDASNGSYGSASRMLLTPAMMLSSSCPDATSLANERDSTPQQQQPSDMGANTRSTSAKRASKQEKGRSNTPARRRNNSKPGDESGNGTSQTATGKDKVGRRGRNKNKENSGSGQQQQQKSKDEPPAAAGKWAWSAFQSSPDPKNLPLPPFLAPPAASGAMGAPQPPPSPYESSSGPPPGMLDLSLAGHHDRPPTPTTPPENEQQPMSIEVSMTQDLRRMLNIGG